MQNFENFVNSISTLDIKTCNIHLRLQSSSIDLDEVNFVGRFETFAEDYATICQKLDIPLDNLVHKNKSSKTEHYKEFYIDELRDKVHQIYLKDIQIFGYRF
jgi:hypothetical protein